jgi:lipopolysaccharide biosynthesis protein
MLVELLEQFDRSYTAATFKPERRPDFDLSSSSVKLIAYYLPQFHPFPENDKWWGQGFTEWTNVTRALPQFPGHCQPQLPADMGFYDLRLVETMERQVALAQYYGISGFCFHFYSFGGKRLLQRPLDLFKANPQIEHDFCLCWANETWSRRWDGSDQEILIQQEHTPEADARLIEDAVQYMEDRRYLHIDGRPVFIVYRASLLADPVATAKAWRAYARAKLNKDLFLVYAMTFGKEDDPAAMGFDAAVQFPPHATEAVSIRDQIRPFRPTYEGHVFDYETISPRMKEKLANFDFPVIPAVFPAWDNTARRGNRAHLFHRSNPDLYATWLAEAAYHADRRPVGGSRLVFINAWNEWAEGAHLEPDQRFGHSYLRVTADVLRPYSNPQTTAFVKPLELPRARSATQASRVAIVLHSFYPDVLDQLLSGMHSKLLEHAFFTVSEETSDKTLSIILRHTDQARIYLVPNRGRDVLPFLQVLDGVRSGGYEVVVKLHTKKTVHRSDGESWFRLLTAPLLELSRNEGLTKFFDEDPNLGLIGPSDFLLNGQYYEGSAGNKTWLDRICQISGVERATNYDFFAGSMFAARLSALPSAHDIQTIQRWFEPEEERRDGTLAHAMERYFGLYAISRGFKLKTLRYLKKRWHAVEHKGLNHGFAFANSVMPMD